MILSLVIIILLVYITIFLTDILFIFVWYQKLNNIANKYVFIIENYGSLTNKEEDSMYKDLEEEGFNLEKLNIKIPKKHENYGQLDEFVIEYSVTLNKFLIESNEKKDIKIKIRKSFYTKK